MLIFNISTILCGCQTVTRDLALQRWNPPSLCFPVQAVLHCVQGQASLEWVSLNNLVNLELEDGGVKLFSPGTRDSGQCTTVFLLNQCIVMLPLHQSKLGSWSTFFTLCIMKKFQWWGVWSGYFGAFRESNHFHFRLQCGNICIWYREW